MSRTKRRRFNRDERNALRKLQELKDYLHDLRELAPDRKPELDAMIGLLTDQQDTFLDRVALDEKKACIELACVNALTISIWRELGLTVDE